MTSLCVDVELFVDGELPPERAEAFRNHLPDCARCQQEVANLLQLEVLGQEHFERAEAQVAAEPPRFAPSARWRPQTLVVAAALVSVLVAIALAVRPEATPAPRGDIWLAQRPQRPLEVRLSHPETDHYRPPPSRMMGTGEPSKDSSLQELSALEKSDPLGLLAAWLVREDLKQAEGVLRRLEEQGPSADLDNYRAALALLQGKPALALGHTARALEQVANHPQALWNQALALEQLHLPLLAAQTFGKVAALKEHGWAEEAAQRAERLQRSVSERHTHWQAVFKSGRALLEDAPSSLPEGFSQTPIARLLFYDAVRASSSREQVLALLPLARQLDARAGGQVLERFVHRVAQADFSRRAPLAREYAALARDNFRKEPQRALQLLEKLRTSGEDDLLMGALANMHPTGRQLELFEEKAAAGGDPWFQLLAAQERAKAEREAGNWSQATRTLLDALGRCPARGLEYRCISLERDLSGLYLQSHEIDAARQHADTGLRQARDNGEWFLERDMLWHLAQLDRYANNAPLARAYYEELLERESTNEDIVRRVHQHLADIEWHELRVDAARHEIDAALATGKPLSLSGAYSLSDISRLKGTPQDETHLTFALDSAAPKLSKGERVLATHVLGRFFIEHEPVRGQDLLRRAIEDSGLPELEEEPTARRARAYSFTSLVMDAGRRGDFEEVLRLLAHERGQELPRQCLLAASVDSERTLLLVRDASGKLIGRYEDTRRHPLPLRLEGLVPEALLQPLRTCQKVDVLARPPLHGRAGILPPEMAWSYLTRTAPPRLPRTGPKVHLVVSEVELPQGSSLPRLNPWTPSFGPEEKQVLLKGTRATPSNVLDAMQEATEIELVTHGIINDRSNASYLLLASGPEGAELRLPQVRELSLRGAPFVMLAACHAAHTSYALHEPLSLPAAFIEAGARGVLAATEKIPDQEANAFFNAIRERMREGTDPALALRNERMKWLREGRLAKGFDSILLFE